MPTPKKKKPSTPKRETPQKIEIREIPAGKYGILISDLPNESTVRPQPLRVHMNLDLMQDLQLQADDFVLLQGNKQALGMLWPEMELDEDYLQITRPTLLNLDIQPQDFVGLRRCAWPVEKARQVKIHTVGDQYLGIYLKEVLIDLEFTLSDQIFHCLYQGKQSEWQLSVVNPKKDTIYRITRETTLIFQDKKPEKISFEDIGGLQAEIQQIRDMIEAPLLHQDRFIEHNIAPPKGLLLFGPPGTGKTLIARAVASEMDCHVSVINGPELHSSFYGETEAKLSNIFEEAKASQPSIIFIDEIDAMCPKRDTSDSELEKRVVATLLTLMDTCKGVFVIGATNRPNAIDDALRRPGRFDREFEIGIPDERRRLDILKRLLKKIPNNLQEQDFEDINARLHGYVGADIAALVKQSGMNCVSRLGKDDTETANDPNLIVEKQDLLKGLGLVRPSIVRDIAVQIPKTRWTDIGGQDDIKQRLKEAVEWPLKHPEVFERFKIQPPKGILLYGPPGNSKTLLAKALATEAGLNFIAVKGPELFSKWVGESEKAVQQVFRKARQASPSIIFFDEIDAIGVKRAGQDASVADRVLSQLLSEMDGVDPLKQVTIVAATNRPDILDSALLRPGRIDSMLYVPPPDHETRKRIFEIQIRKMPTDNLDLEHLAALSDGFSGAETVAVCQKAAMNAMEENMDCSTIEQRHFEQAIRSTVPRLNQELLQFYIDFQNQNGLHAI